MGNHKNMIKLQLEQNQADIAFVSQANKARDTPGFSGDYGEYSFESKFFYRLEQAR